MRSQIIAIFIVEHTIDISPVSLVPWRLYCGGLVCSNGQGFGIAFISPHGAVLEASCRLGCCCTNVQS